MRVAACLCDLDGVLTDTASVHLRAWRAVFERETGVPFGDDDYLTWVDGKPRSDGVRDYLRHQRGDVDEATVSRVGEAKQQLVEQLIRDEGVRVFDDTRPFLERCVGAGVRRAVVSSSANTPLVLEVTGLRDLVEVVVDGGTAARQGLAGKPRPDTFLAAATALDLPYADCAVLEDALAGVEAGRAGGFGLVVGVDRLGGRDDALRTHGADVVVSRLTEISL